ncbi:MAG: hypothetical protein Q9P01_17275 [Anaerolineae bacterium]|nr:hypothetical protein [Anaerolineae bacterium]MDQ7036513.1 hypothetical protein [Anaerolineae bacterium]
MKSAANIFGGLLILIGIIWSLQGANILPGSFMTGQIEWLIIGVIFIALGIALIVWRNRQNKAKNDN